MDYSRRDALNHYQQELRTGIKVINFLPALRPLLTAVEYQVIADKRLQGNVAMVDELIDTLLTKENEQFDGFCTALHDNGYAHWAKKLRNTAQVVISAGPCQQDDLSPHSVGAHVQQTSTLSPVATKSEKSEIGKHDGMQYLIFCG